MTARRVAVVAAMPTELQPFRRMVSLAREDIDDDLVVYEGRVGSVDVVAATSGIGTAAATGLAERLLETFTIDHLVVIGVAGGLGPEVRVRDLIVPSRVQHEGTWREHRAAPFGDLPGEGLIVTSDEFITDPDRLAGIVERGALAIDMETAAFADVSERRAIPWSAFRAVSDGAEGEPLDQDLFDLARPDGSPDLGAAMRYVAGRPWRVPRLVRLGRDARAASVVAARAAADGLRCLA